MTEMVPSGSMSGDARRSDGLLGESGHERRRSQQAPPVLHATARVLDSTYWDRTEVHIRMRGEPPDPRVRRLAMVPLVVFVLIALAAGVRAGWWGFPQLADDAAALWAVAEAEYRNRITVFGFLTVKRIAVVALAVAVPIAVVALLYQRWRRRGTHPSAASASAPPRTPGT